MLPSNYARMPVGSISSKFQSELVAANIMKILERTGNKWRYLTWAEYKSERIKDGNFSSNEFGYFEEVVDFCQSEETANVFCEYWGKE